MTVSILLSIAGFITAALCGTVAYLYRGKTIPVSWLAFVVMGLGAFSIGAFYTEISILNYHGKSIIPMIPFSRVLWWLILFTTSLMAAAAIYQKCCKNK